MLKTNTLCAISTSTVDFNKKFKAKQKITNKIK